jgi:AcrR family transcriptional regulator
MDDIARQAGAAKGLISYSFHSKRGCCLAIVQDRSPAWSPPR